MPIQYQVLGEIALIKMDYQPVNSISAELRTDLMAAINQSISDHNIRAIVLAGTPRAFSAGADIKEFNTPQSTREPRLATIIEAFDNSPLPIIAAISGVCIGGGLELALAAHYRVAHAEALVGMPEVKLGLIPGAGGTQRLPRAIGLARAIDMVVSGDPQRAAQLQNTLLFDRVTDSDPVAAAIQLAIEVADLHPLPRLRDKPVNEPDSETILRQARHDAESLLPSQRACIDALSWSVYLPFDEALQRERSAFLQLMDSTESRALRYAFAAERAAAHVEGVKDTKSLISIHTVAVLGAGTMGAGIATALLNAGLSVQLLETSQAALERGYATIKRNLERSQQKGKLTQSDVQKQLQALKLTLEYGHIAEVDLVIEAVFEDMGVKEEVFRKLDAVCKPGAILATNTSYLDVNTIASFTQRPENVVGLHFFSPAHVMRLLEIVQGEKTDAHVLATCIALARQLKKIGVVARVCDGFIGNRMLFRYTAAAFELVRMGAMPQQIDAALQAFGMSMGPLRMGDLAGLDVSWAVRKRRALESKSSTKPVIPDRLCEAARFGQKTGAGWYRYEPGKHAPLLDPITDALIDEFRREQGVTPRRVSDTEIIERCILALINEGAKILEEGIAARASDIDVIYLNGYGFPRHRGGPMFYADTVGLNHVVATLQRFANEPDADPSWQPAPLLMRLAMQNMAFHA